MDNGKSVVAIWNRGLNNVGGKAVESVEESSPIASRLRIVYPQIRDELLEMHPWSFAQKVATLALIGTPDTNYSYAYKLPSDYIKALQLKDKADHWEIFGDELHTNRERAVLIYTARIEEVGRYPASFSKALAALISAAMAYPVTSKPAMTDLWEDKALKLIDAAMAADAREGNEAQPQVSVFEQSRYGTPPGESLGVFKEPTASTLTGWIEE